MRLCVFARVWLLLAIALQLAAPFSAAALSGRVVDKDGHGIEDAVVFVAAPRAGATLAGVSAVMDQIHKQFVPHILPVVVGTSVHFPNRDQIHHHVYSFSRTKSFEIPLHKGEPTDPVLFDKEGVVKVGCNIHDWMSGVILVLPNPHFTVSDASGQFQLDLAPGTYPLTAWHERAEVDPDKVRRDVEVKDGAPPLVIELPLSAERSRAAVHGLRGYE